MLCPSTHIVVGVPVRFHHFKVQITTPTFPKVKFASMTTVRVRFRASAPRAIANDAHASCSIRTALWITSPVNLSFTLSVFPIKITFHFVRGHDVRRFGLSNRLPVDKSPSCSVCYTNKVFSVGVAVTIIEGALINHVVKPGCP